MMDRFEEIKGWNTAGYSLSGEHQGWLVAEVERLRRLEDLLLANADRLETDPTPIGKLLRWIEFNLRPSDGEAVA